MRFPKFTSTEIVDVHLFLELLFYFIYLVNTVCVESFALQMNNRVWRFEFVRDQYIITRITLRFIN